MVRFLIGWITIVAIFVSSVPWDSWLGGMAADEDEEDEVPAGELEEAKA